MDDHNNARKLDAGLRRDILASPVGGPIRGPSVRAMAAMLAPDLGFPAHMLAGEESHEAFMLALEADKQRSE